MAELESSTGIWRYMDVARFLALIYEKKIYFPRLHELDDPWEGARSHSDPTFSRDPEYAGLAAQEFNRHPLISCWHENEVESVAMWKLYVSGREGVAIKTTIARLGRFASADRELKIGRVEYREIDDSGDWPKALHFEYGVYTGYKGVINAERALFRKNKGYGHEREVRAIRYETYCAEQVIWTHPDKLTRLSRGEVVPGEAVPIDPSFLIERIVVIPQVGDRIPSRGCEYSWYPS
jgi:hypothetical protein